MDKQTCMNNRMGSVLIVAVGVLLFAAPAGAVNVIKLDTASMASNTSNWSAAPAITDVGEFDGTCSAANMAALTLGGNLTLGGLQFDSTMTGPATILSGSNLTLGTSGINMANANTNVTINCGLRLGGSQTWTVGAGRTLSLTGLTVTAGNQVVTVAGSGTVNLNSSYSENLSNDGSGLKFSGGTVAVNGGISFGRTASFGTVAPSAASPISASSENGLVVNGATVSVSSTIHIGTGHNAISSSSMLVSSGSLTSSGAIVVGKNAGTSRWNPCQVSGGTLTVYDTGTGLQLSPNNGAATNNAELYVSGGTANLGKISYGATDDTLGGAGWTIVKGGDLYIGSGGVVKATPVGAYSVNFSLHSGLLGASADWSSTVDMALSGPAGTPFTIQAADAAAAPHNITLSGAISGTGSITKTGGGTLVLAGANTYAGSTTLNAGTLQLGDGGTSGNLGTADASGIAITGTLAFKRSDNVTYSGVISGTGALSQRGSGSLTLTQANTYEGGTTVSNGTLIVNNTSGSGTGTGAILLQGGLLGGTGSVSGTVTANVNGGLAPGNSVGTLTVGSLTLNNGATNRFEFSSTPANDQAVVSTADGLVLNGGAFALYAEGGITPWTTNGTYNLIQYSGSISGTATDGSGNLNSDWTTASAFNPHVANPEPGLSYAFGLSGGWLTVTVSSDASVSKGTWTGSSDGNWSVAGNWTAETGVMPPKNARDTAVLGESTALRTVTLDTDVSLGTLSFNNANSFVVANGGYTLTLDKAGVGAALSVTAGATNQILAPVKLNDNAEVSMTNGALLSVTGTIGNTGDSKTLTVSGEGTLALAGANSYGPQSGSLGTTLSGGGVVRLGHASALGAGDVSVGDIFTLQAGAAGLNVTNNIGIATGGTVTVDNASYAMTLRGLVSGSGALTKAGSGELSIISTNEYTGGTVIGAGAVSLSTLSAGNRGLGLGTVTITNNARLALYYSSLDGDPVGAASTFVNNLVVPSGAEATLWHSARGLISGSLTGSGTLNLRVSYIRGYISGNWSAFAGQINVSTRDGDDDCGFPNGNPGLPQAALHLNNGVNFYMYNTFPSGGATFPIGTLSGDTNSFLASGSTVSGRMGTYQVGARNEDSVFAGMILDSTGATALTKVGSGTLTLSHSNSTYTGATAVNEGMLKVVGKLTASPVTVASGAKLAGSGTLGGLVTLASGNATIALTNGVAETLTLAGGLTLNDGNVIALDLNATGDVLAMTGGTFTRNGTVTVKVNALAGYTGGTRDLITGIGITDASGFVLEGLPAEFKVKLVATNGNLQLKTMGGTLVRIL